MSERVSKAHHFQDYIETFDLWKPLTTEQRVLLAAHTHYRRCTKGEIIHRGALGHLGTLHIVSGTLRVYVVTDEGRELTLCFMRVLRGHDYSSGRYGAIQLGDGCLP